MKYNCVDDMGNSMDVNKHHEKMLANIGLHEWIGEIKCPFCNEKLGLSSIRAITFKTNARNIGDLCIDFVCKDCKAGDYVYFRQAFETTKDINDIINGAKIPNGEPIVEERMYSMQYNNVVDHMISSRSDKKEPNDHN